MAKATSTHRRIAGSRGRRLAATAFVAAMLPVAAARAQAQAQPTPACPPTTTLDQLPNAIDDAVSGPGDKDRACLRAALLPEARLIPVTVGADGKAKTTIYSVDDFIDRLVKRGDKAFYEHQVKYATETYGNIAHLWSTYAITETPDGKPTVRGINSIEAINDGTRWRVLQISWQAETPAAPIPPQFLP
jgi:hypothetical protein